MNRRFMRCVFVFLLAGSVTSAGFGWGASVKLTAFDVRETTIAQTQAAIQAGKVTCRQLVEAYRKRILAYDQTTHLNSMILLNPEAPVE
jgi:amidase